MAKYIYNGKQPFRATLSKIDLILTPGALFEVEFDTPNSHFDKMIERKEVIVATIDLVNKYTAHLNN